MDIRLVCLNCDRAIEIPSAGEDHPCPLCGATVSVELPPEPEVPGLSTAFAYPFSSAGSIVFLAFMAPIWALARTWGGCLGYLLFGGYVALWLWDILSTTSMGKHKAPAAPMMTDFGELIGCFFRFFGALFIAFLPAGVAGLALHANDVPPTSPLNAIPAALSFLGVFYYPMALMLIGFSERWSASLHLVFAAKSIRTLGVDYLLCCVFVLVTFGVSAAIEAGMAALPRDLGLGARAGIATAGTFIELALYAVQMRAVGLLYLANKDRLGWFRS